MFARLYASLRGYHNELLWLVLSVVAIVMFFTFHPLVRLRWNHHVAQVQAQHWQQAVTKYQYVDAAEWIEFRASYAPGEFTYNPDVLAVYSILQFKYLDTLSVNTLFTYRGWDNYLVSKESLALIGKAEGTRDVFMQTYPNATWLVEKTDTVYGTQDNKTLFWMKRPFAEMKEINGLINYEDPTKVLEKNEWYWVTEAVWTQPGQKVETTY